jgi:hypothetical protein
MLVSSMTPANTAIIVRDRWNMATPSIRGSLRHSGDALRSLAAIRNILLRVMLTSVRRLISPIWPCLSDRNPSWLQQGVRYQTHDRGRGDQQRVAEFVRAVLLHFYVDIT